MFTQISMILALETSSSLCAVCVLDPLDGKALLEVANDIGRGHAERLMGDVTEALAQAGIGYADLTAVACGVGPGSFTGIRVGVAAARGFALALKIKVCGVTSLQAIALLARPHAGGKPVLVVQDAGREEFHVQRFDADARPLALPQALTFPAKRIERILSERPNAIVHGLKWLQTAGPGDIIKTVPESYLLGDRALYLASFNKVRESISLDGLIPEDGARTALRALASFDPSVKADKIDISKTYTNEFARRSKERFKA